MCLANRHHPRGVACGEIGQAIEQAIECALERIAVVQIVEMAGVLVPVGERAHAGHQQAEHRHLRAEHDDQIRLQAAGQGGEFHQIAQEAAGAGN